LSFDSAFFRSENTYAEIHVRKRLSYIMYENEYKNSTV